MNSSSLFHFAEWACLILVLLLAMGIAVPIRRALTRRARALSNALEQWLWAVVGSLLFPLLAMGLGWVLLWAPEAFGVSWADWVPRSHRSAWHLFWMVMTAFNFAETTAMQIYSAGGKFQVPALLRGVTRIVVTSLAAFFVLRFELGFNITPLLASTALVTAVVGFALQGVLGNLLAGMSLNLTGAMAHRDWVFIDDLEGQVEEMNWRETWILTRDKIPIRIPNSKVADARIQNLTRPEGPRRCSIFVDASYNDPPDAVIESMLAAAAAVPEVRQSPAPDVLLLEYKSYGIGYQMRVWLDSYPFRDPVLANVRRHIWYQFRRRGIQIPYPVTDQVMNNFMERAIVPASRPGVDPDAQRRSVGLIESDFARKVLTGADGKKLVAEEELAEWAGHLSSQLYGRDEVLFRQGDVGDSCYVVMSGTLTGHIHHRESGKQTTFEVGAGAVVGEMSLVTGLPRMADVRVKESAELLRIPALDFAALLGKHEGLVEQISQLVSVRVQQNRKQVEDLMASGSPSVDQAISKEGILRRFFRLLGG